MALNSISINFPTVRLNLNKKLEVVAKTIKVSLQSVTRLVIKQLLLLFSFIKKFLGVRSDITGLKPQEAFSRKRRFSFEPLKTKKFAKTAAFVVLAILLIVVISKLFKSPSGASGPDTRQEVKGAKAVLNLNKGFSFPLKDEAGNQVADIRYEVENVELRDEIVVKGQKATSVKGRTFLILTLKITNEYDRPVQMNSRDYVRLSVNGNENEWLAPDIHNDPVEVQAISTKATRVGFPINDTDKNLVLKVGEIDKDKETLELKFD